MCVTSVVMDTWGPYIPNPTYPWPNTSPPPNTTPPWTPNTTPLPMPVAPPQVVPGTENDHLKKVLETFRKAYEAAEEFDELTGQPDCVDPEKEKLVERVEELERRLASLEDKT